MYGERLIFICNIDIPRGIIGLLASRMSRTYPHSLVVVATKPQEDQWVASLRSGSAGLISVFFEASESLFLDHGGHDKAGGFSLIEANMSILKIKLKEMITLFSPIKEESEQIFIDAQLNEEHLSTYALNTVQLFEPYGQGFDALIFMSRSVMIKEMQLIGKLSEHLKLSVALNGVCYPAFWWQIGDHLDRIKVGQSVDLIYNLVRDSEKSAGFYLDIKDIKEG
jgi:single-stranded-DNA-specific exonuclease